MDDKPLEIPPGGFLGDADAPAEEKPAADAESAPAPDAAPKLPDPGELSIGEPAAGAGLDLGGVGDDVEALGGGEGELSSIFGGEAPPSAPDAAPAGETPSEDAAADGGEEDGIGGTFLGDSSLTEDIGDLGFPADSEVDGGEAPAAEEDGDAAKSESKGRKIPPVALWTSVAIASVVIIVGAVHMLFGAGIQKSIKGKISLDVEKRLTRAATEGITGADVKKLKDKMKRAVNNEKVEIADFQLLRIELSDRLKDGALQMDDLAALEAQLGRVR